MYNTRSDFPYSYEPSDFLFGNKKQSVVEERKYYNKCYIGEARSPAKKKSKREKAWAKSSNKTLTQQPPTKPKLKIPRL